MLRSAYVSDCSLRIQMASVDHIISYTTTRGAPLDILEYDCNSFPEVTKGLVEHDTNDFESRRFTKIPIQYRVPK